MQRGSGANARLSDPLRRDGPTGWSNAGIVSEWPLSLDTPLGVSKTR